MGTKTKEKHFYSPTKQKVLLLLAAGLALGLSHSFRKQIYILRAIKREWKWVNRSYLYRILREFREERLIDYREREDGTINVVLSEKGRQRSLSFKFDTLAIKAPDRWDGKWRTVLYDIPEKKKPAREALRAKLKELGFYEWQKSVWVHPFPCRDEIDFVIEVFDLRPYVRYAEFIQTTNEAELKLYFNL